MKPHIYLDLHVSKFSPDGNANDYYNRYDYDVKILVKSIFICNNFRKFNIPHISAIWILHLIADFCVKRKFIQYPVPMFEIQI